MAAVKFPALILNPRSSGNKKNGKAATPRGLVSAAPSTIPELRSTLADYARQEIDLLIVSGGDGTLREVLTALPAAYGSAPLPAISIVAAGNANSIAHDVGQTHLDADSLPALLSAARDNRWRRDEQRCPIAVHWPDGSSEPVYGFFMGAAALTRATRHFHDHVTTGGKLSVAVTLAATMSRSLRGKGSWISGDWLGIGVDGQPEREGHRFLFLATSLHKLMLGLWPFWGDQNPQQHPIHYLDVDAHPPRLGRSLLPLLRGRPTATMLSSKAYRSGMARELSLQLAPEQTLIIDGEPFAADSSGRLMLKPGPQFRFVAL